MILIVCPRSLTLALQSSNVSIHIRKLVEHDVMLSANDIHAVKMLFRYFWSLK